MRFNARFYIRIDLGVANERGWCARECTPRAAVEGMSHLPRPSFLSTIQSSGVPSTRHGDAPSCPGRRVGGVASAAAPETVHTHIHTYYSTLSPRVPRSDALLAPSRRFINLKTPRSRPNWLRFSWCMLTAQFNFKWTRTIWSLLCLRICASSQRNPGARTKAMNLIYVLIYQYMRHFAVYGEMRNVHLIWVALFFFCIQSLFCLFFNCIYHFIIDQRRDLPNNYRKLV
jgi:hypothetical protein